MIKMFSGMIIGSIMTMMLLGGASAADQILANAQVVYLDHINRPDAFTSLLLLIMLGLILAVLSVWPTRPVIEAKKFIKHLRRHCS